MTQDAQPSIDLLSHLPAGWTINLSWFNDDYPCVTVTLSRDHGKERVEAFGHGNTLVAALGWAVHDALVLIARAEEKAKPPLRGLVFIENDGTMRPATWRDT